MHKMNVFHWHLSDDDGWRIEIKKYPRLTQVGAWRGSNEALPASYGSGDQRYGGFYTQEQIRDIIAYATARHILIVPEIDVPAHSRAAIVAYPELLCTGDPYKFKSVQDVPANVLCPSQERTYEFLEGVFGELADLFPGPYLHAGGDERPKGPWEQCDRCREHMKAEKLSSGDELQDRFLKRLQGILRAHGKKMIGWDELKQQSVLDHDYTVMAWNSVDAGIRAAQKGYPVILTPPPRLLTSIWLTARIQQNPACVGQESSRWKKLIRLTPHRRTLIRWLPLESSLCTDVSGRKCLSHPIARITWHSRVFAPWRKSHGRRKIGGPGPGFRKGFTRITSRVWMRRGLLTVSRFRPSIVAGSKSRLRSLTRGRKCA
jgi:hypothetical protein